MISLTLAPSLRPSGLDDRASEFGVSGQVTPSNSLKATTPKELSKIDANLVVGFPDEHLAFQPTAVSTMTTITTVTDVISPTPSSTSPIIMAAIQNVTDVIEVDISNGNAVVIDETRDRSDAEGDCNMEAEETVINAPGSPSRSGQSLVSVGKTSSRFTRRFSQLRQNCSTRRLADLFSSRLTMRQSNAILPPAVLPPRPREAGQGLIKTTTERPKSCRSAGSRANHMKTIARAFSFGATRPEADNLMNTKVPNKPNTVSPFDVVEQKDPENTKM
ncbi:unnamed protein product [Protopolystoma xenopodis]|uniref:Uncharacterized protein n=1 Tax=Protopolystoma xenopodis TaxID=117903 RepID=A0A3S5AI62_9PLAT|nr:unnamed protein product [Protopolystoma xenopodis]